MKNPRDFTLGELEILFIDSEMLYPAIELLLNGMKIYQEELRSYIVKKEMDKIKQINEERKPKDRIDFIMPTE